MGMQLDFVIINQNSGISLLLYTYKEVKVRQAYQNVVSPHTKI